MLHVRVKLTCYRQVQHVISTEGKPAADGKSSYDANSGTIHVNGNRHLLYQGDAPPREARTDPHFSLTSNGVNFYSGTSPQAKIVPDGQWEGKA